MTDRRVRAALLDYLRSARRLRVLREDRPLWTRHDAAGEPGAQLSSWSFVENLKRYVNFIPGPPACGWASGQALRSEQRLKSLKYWSQSSPHRTGTLKDATTPGPTLID